MSPPQNAQISVGSRVLHHSHNSSSLFCIILSYSMLLAIFFISNAGHTSNMKNPETFNQKITNFLKKDNIAEKGGKGKKESLLFNQ